MKTINKILSEAFKKYANNVAVKMNNQIITYKELDELSNIKANYLLNMGVKREDFIGVIFEHNIDLIINIVAVIKSGAAYIPIEPFFPIERINYILESSPVKFVLIQDKYRNLIRNKKLILKNNYDNLNYLRKDFTNTCDANNALYVLYTSGTTGTPKGVIIEHKNVVNYIEAFKREFSITQKDKMLQNSVVTFDIFTEELFPILSCGGQLVINPDSQRDNAKAILKLINDEKITLISCFPYLVEDINYLLSNGENIPISLKTIISGGDILRKEYCSNLFSKVKIYNTYGPTETTVVCSYYHYKETCETSNFKTVPIGKSIYGTEMIVVDEKYNKVLPGEIGEICILGNGVGRGYLNNKEETDKKFVSSPFNKSKKMYLSGDLGLLTEDGTIEFIKRKDDQVMINGKRVEPLEIENLLYKLPDIKYVVIKSYKDSKEKFYLVGYINFINEVKIDKIKEYLEKYLPEYMIPEFWVEVDKFQKTNNGKIDKKALPKVLK